VIRLAVDADFAAIAAITNHWIRHTAIHFATSEQSADELLASAQAGGGIHPWLVLTTADGAVAGYAKAGTLRQRAAYRWAVETGIYLAPEHCGQWRGRRLYARLLEVLRAQGFHAALGGIALPNDASVRLHERLGFRCVGVVPRAGRKFDRWHDVGFWHLPLQPPDAMPGELAMPAAAFAATADRAG
jgi:phosphinothricin acetyltransferase